MGRAVHVPDGVRPKAALCPRCRYRFGGIPIHNGAIVCPECGHRFEFRFPTRARPRSVGRRRTLPLALAVAALVAMGVWAVRESPELALATAAAGVLLVAGVVGLTRLRNTMIADPGPDPDAERDDARP